MKRILLLYIMVLLLPSLCRAQITYFVEANSKLEEDNDFWFNDVGNRGGEGIVLDGVFIKSGIGIDWHLVENADTSLCPVRYPVWIKGVGNRNDSVLLACPPGKTKEGYVMIGGMKCSILSFFHYMKEEYKLVSLEDIRKKDFPDVKGNVVYMINKFFIEFYMLKCNSCIFFYIVFKMLGLKNQQVFCLVCCIVIIVSNFFYICLIFIENIRRKAVIYIVSIKLFFYLPQLSRHIKLVSTKSLLIHLCIFQDVIVYQYSVHD